MTIFLWLLVQNNSVEMVVASLNILLNSFTLALSFY